MNASNVLLIHLTRPRLVSNQEFFKKRKSRRWKFVKQLYQSWWSKQIPIFLYWIRIITFSSQPPSSARYQNRRSQIHHIYMEVIKVFLVSAKLFLTFNGSYRYPWISIFINVIKKDCLVACNKLYEYTRMSPSLKRACATFEQAIGMNLASENLQ